MSEDKIYPTMVIRSQAEAIELLEKENKRLKLELSGYREAILKEDKKKAREYIKDQEDYFNNYPLIDRKYLLEILEDKE